LVNLIEAPSLLNVVEESPVPAPKSNIQIPSASTKKRRTIESMFDEEDDLAPSASTNKSKPSGKDSSRKRAKSEAIADPKDIQRKPASKVSQTKEVEADEPYIEESDPPEAEKEEDVCEEVEDVQEDEEDIREEAEVIRITAAPRSYISNGDGRTIVNLCLEPKRKSFAKQTVRMGAIISMR
jgi:hypothetical protein